MTFAVTGLSESADTVYFSLSHKRRAFMPLGARLEIIQFGSRSVLYLPQERYRVTVAVGDRLAAGQTPLAVTFGN